MQPVEHASFSLHPDGAKFVENQPSVTLSDLLHRTGFGLKIRFLFALTLIALLPSVALILLLGDPTGTGQQGTVGVALFAQAQAEAQAINQVISERQTSVRNLANEHQIGRTNGQLVLQAAQTSDPSSLAWVLVNPAGTIVASGDPQNALAGTALTQAHLVSSSAPLLQLVQAATPGTALPAPAIERDAQSKQVWLALAAPLPERDVLLAVFSLPQLLQHVMITSNNINSSTSLLLDQRDRIAASMGALAPGQQLLEAVPTGLATLRSNTANPTVVANDPLTGRTDLAVGVTIPALHGCYIALASRETTLVSNNGSVFAGRNTPLLLLGVFVAVVLVATWVALPIIRPIRRATRVIEATTDHVRTMAADARTIADDHLVGTTILSGASKKLAGRRQTIIRDTTLIAQTCRAAMPHLQSLSHGLQGSQEKWAFTEITALYQSLQQIHATATVIADGLGKDASHDQLEQAMLGAHDISRQFRMAGQQLDLETRQLETAARSLI